MKECCRLVGWPKLVRVLLLQVSGEDEYKVCMCTRHAVLEHQRAEGFQQLLQGPFTLPEHLLNLGELLFQVSLRNFMQWVYDYVYVLVVCLYIPHNGKYTYLLMAGVCVCVCVCVCLLVCHLVPFLPICLLVRLPICLSVTNLMSVSLSSHVCACPYTYAPKISVPTAGKPEPEGHWQQCS